MGGIGIVSSPIECASPTKCTSRALQEESIKAGKAMNKGEGEYPKKQQADRNARIFFHDSFAFPHAGRASRALIGAISRLLDLPLTKTHFTLPTARQTGRRTGAG